MTAIPKCRTGEGGKSRGGISAVREREGAAVVLPGSFEAYSEVCARAARLWRKR